MKLSLKEILNEFNSAEVEVKILNNHGHKMIVSADDVSLGEEEVYDIQGASDHSHTVTLSVDDFEKLSMGEVINLRSSIDKNHNHIIKLKSKPFRNDAPNPEQPRSPWIEPGSSRKKGY